MIIFTITVRFLQSMRAQAMTIFAITPKILLSTQDPEMIIST